MSLSIDLTTYGRELQQAYDRIISGAADTTWAVFSYDRGASNELKVQATGSALPRESADVCAGGELDEIVDEFSDGRISYGCNGPSPAELTLQSSESRIRTQSSPSLSSSDGYCESSCPS